MDNARTGTNLGHAAGGVFGVAVSCGAPYRRAQHLDCDAVSDPNETSAFQRYRARSPSFCLEEPLLSRRGLDLTFDPLD
jgi:hypothetical protein